MVRASKLLTYVLSTDPGRIGILLDPDGWVPVRDLLDAMRRNGHRLTRSELLEIVEGPDAARFEHDGVRNRIRASRSVAG